VWSRTVEKPAVVAYRERLTVLSTQLHAGRTRLRVLAETAPDGEFAPAAPALEDVYFRALAQSASDASRTAA
jgi:hypothetical protein